MDSLRQIQNQRLQQLPRFINGAFFYRSDRVLGVFFRKLPYARHTRHLCGLQSSFRSAAAKVSTISEQLVSIAPWRGEDPHVQRMSESLKMLEHYLIGAYLHGSIANSETCSYSDFDALVILKDEVFESESKLIDVASRLGSLQAIMYEYDPLQHHGWFVLTESDLRFYSEAYFPLALFPYSSSLLTNAGKTLMISPRPSREEAIYQLQRMTQGVVNTVSDGTAMRSLYGLKSFSSQMMLLPALYLQALTGEGVYKKHSFQLAKGDFTEALWRPIEIFSVIRERWPVMPAGSARRLAARPGPFRSRIVSIATRRIPYSVRCEVTASLLAQSQRLALAMWARVAGCG